MTGPAITITQEMIDAYAAISGDFNPVHVDEAYAAGTAFGGTIAHGCIPMEPIFRLVQARTGRPVMVEGSTMRLRYLRPARPGDTIGIETTAEEEDRLAFRCMNQRGETVIEGEVRPGEPAAGEKIEGI